MLYNEVKILEQLELERPPRKGTLYVEMTKHRLQREIFYLSLRSKFEMRFEILYG